MPNDSSLKFTIRPSHVNVAECQKSTATSPRPGPSVSTLSSYTQIGFAVSGSMSGPIRHSWACSAQAAPTSRPGM
jgi:hypothetical protein